MNRSTSTHKLVYCAMMAAIVCAVTFLRFPLFGSKVHLANAMCLLSGLLLGPVAGGVAAGLGSFLYDALWGGYDIIQCLITFVSKFLMAFICAKLAGRDVREENNNVRVILACWVGAISYVVLYMLKTFIYQRFVYGFPMDTVGVTMLSKLPASLINAVFAAIVAPVAFRAVLPALKRMDKEKTQAAE